MDNIFSVFGNNVRKYRINKGYSQEDFANKIGLHRTYISAVERGRRNISLNNIDKIANGLDVSICALFNFEEMQ